LVALVAVEDEDGQQTTDVRPHNRCAAEVVALGVRLLAQHGDVVAGARPFPRKSTGVDVRARSSQQIPVPQQDPHTCLSLDWGSNDRLHPADRSVTPSAVPTLRSLSMPSLKPFILLVHV